MRPNSNNDAPRSIVGSKISLPLADSQIRQALVKRLSCLNPKPRAVIHELRVQNGNAIADIVTLHSEAHCYEIKGCNDKIERITVQGEYYNKSFRRITLVTTDRNLDHALRITPPFWGIMVARWCTNSVTFKYIRKASLNPLFDKEIATLTLWKSEMLNLLKERHFESKTRNVLASLIANAKQNLELSTTICDLLVSRQSALNTSVEDHV